MPTLESFDGTKLNYLDLGSGDPVVFLHGRGLSLEFYEYQIASLSSHFRILAYDLRGHGDSDKPLSRYSHEEFADDLSCFIERLGLKKVVLVGASTGSFIIHNYVKNHSTDNISAICLTSTTPVFVQDRSFPYAMTLDQFDEMKKNLMLDHPRAVANFFKFITYKELSPETSSWMFGLGVRTPLFVLLKTLESNIKMDYRDTLKKFDKPTLIAQGENDPLTPIEAAKFMHSEITNSRLAIIPESGHLPYLEQSQRYTSELEAFIEDSLKNH